MLHMDIMYQNGWKMINILIHVENISWKSWKIYI
jgi:hypothetical protein